MSLTFANVVRLDLDVSTQENNETDSNCEIVLECEKAEVVLTPKEQYMIENDLALYDFNNDMKIKWEHLGFLTELKHKQIVDLIDKCITVTELEEDTELDEFDEDYSESDIYD